MVWSCGAEWSSSRCAIRSLRNVGRAASLLSPVSLLVDERGRVYERELHPFYTSETGIFLSGLFSILPKKQGVVCAELSTFPHKTGSSLRRVINILPKNREQSAQTVYLGVYIGECSMDGVPRGVHRVVYTRVCLPSSLNRVVYTRVMPPIQP